MNVAELIEKLKALPQDLPVVLDAEEYGQSAPIFVGEVFALKALEESNWFGEYLCDEDPERLVLRVATVPEFPDNPVPVKVVTLSCRDSYVDQSPTLAQELEQWEKASDEDMGLYLSGTEFDRAVEAEVDKLIASDEPLIDPDEEESSLKLWSDIIFNKDD